MLSFLLMVGGNRITQAVVGAHEGGVFSLCPTKDGNLLSGGGKDRKVFEWDSTYSKTGRETEVGREQLSPAFLRICDKTIVLLFCFFFIPPAVKSVNIFSSLS